MLIPVPTDEKAATALAQPLSKFIEVVAAGMGKVYEPVATIIQAHADGASSVIRANSDIKVQEVQQRALTRLLSFETRRQGNIENTVARAREALPDKVSDAPVDPDWIAHFFDSVKDVSNEDMQGIWARILAGEVAEPGKTSRRTLETLKEMDRNDAELFTRVVWLSFRFGNWLQIFSDKSVDSHLEILIKGTSAQAVINHMINIGMISSEAGVVPASSATGMQFVYGGVEYRMSGPLKPAPYPNGLPALEKYFYLKTFTSVGNQLADFVAPELIPQLVSSLSESLNAQMGVTIALASKSDEMRL